MKKNATTETLSLLDKALDFLISSETHSLHFNDLKNMLFNDSYSDITFVDYKSKTVDELFAAIFEQDKVELKTIIKINEVLLFLESKKMLSVIEDGHLRITYQGIIQHSKGYLTTYISKSKTYQRVRNVENVQKFHLTWMTILTSIIAIGTLVAAIYYIFEIFSVRLCVCK